MALPGIGRGVGSGSKSMGKQVPRRGGQPSPSNTQLKRSVAPWSPEGLIMLGFAAFVEIFDFIIGILDFLVAGIILGPIIHGFAAIVIGIWLWTITGKFILLRIGVPLVGNSFPLIKFFPLFWLGSVWSALDKTGGHTEQTNSQETQQAYAY